MKIVDVVPYAFWVSIRNQLLVKIVTDGGITGWGESGLSSREQAVAGAMAHFRDLLIGKDPMNIGALWQEMYRSNYFEGGRVLTAAISAIDIALHDVVGQALGVPVYQLLGGKQRNEVPTFASTGATPGESMVNEAVALVEAGWGAVRLSIAGQDAETQFDPRLSIAETAEWVKKTRRRIGAGTVLGVDYHHRLSVAEAASFCNMLPAGTLDFLEEPIRAEDPVAYEALRKLSQIPFAIGEEFSSKWQFLPFLERGITQFARIDVCNVGGLTEAMKVASLAESHYLDVMPHNPLGPVATAASIHFSAAIPNLSWLETLETPGYASRNFHKEEFFPKRPRLRGAAYPIDEEPGLGVQVNEQAIASSPFRYHDHPRLRRNDGTITNW